MRNVDVFDTICQNSVADRLWIIINLSTHDKCRKHKGAPPPSSPGLVSPPGSHWFANQPAVLAGWLHHYIMILTRPGRPLSPATNCPDLGTWTVIPKQSAPWGRRSPVKTSDLLQWDATATAGTGPAKYGLLVFTRVMRPSREERILIGLILTILTITWLSSPLPTHSPIAEAIIRWC